MEKKKDFEVWAMKILKEYKNVLHLQQFHPMQIQYKDDHPGAECQFHYPYSSIIVRYGSYLKGEFDKKNLEYVKKVLVHELCHMVTDPFYAKATTMWTSKSEIEDERERLTDHLANIVLGLKP